MMPPLLALFSWPAVVLVLGRTLAGPLAFILAILLGFLFLPENTSVDLPMLPALTKHSLPALAVLLFLPLFLVGDREGPHPPLFPRHWAIRIAVLALVIGAFMTVSSNGDMLFPGGGRVLRGLQTYDAFSEILSVLILILPMLLARRLLARPEHHLLLIKVICIAMLGYSLLALYEIRMSPQLNRMVYGFFPHSWVQHIRGGGFRPLVFLEHGLILALAMAMAVLAAAGLSRLDRARRSTFLGAMLWLLMTLVLSKSLGALLIALVLLPVALVLRLRTMLIVATLIAGFVMVYPMARSVGLVPVDQVEELAAGISESRAASFAFRLRNEDALLARANERPAFGWGGWGRNRIYDDETGRDTSTTDGYWIILLGTGGWVRYLSIFGLLCLPIGLLLVQARRAGIGLESGVLALMLAANLTDLIPNASLTPLTWVIAGALWGRVELGRIEERGAVPAGADAAGEGSGRREPAYRRATPPPAAGRDAAPDWRRVETVEQGGENEGPEPGDPPGSGRSGEGTPRYSRQGRQHRRRRDRETADD